MARADFDDTFPNLSAQLEDGYGDLLRIVKNLYDWSLLMGMLGNESSSGSPMISQRMVKIYETHRCDLKDLKYICKTYLKKDEYNAIFKDESVKDNYVWYSYHFKGKMPESGKRTTQEEFCKLVRKYLAKIKSSTKDAEIYERILNKAENNTLCPKQVSTENRVIPYQLYYIELRQILENAKSYIPLLQEQDEYGTVADKILSIMRFRIPYYVGPLVSDNTNPNAWMVRRAEGKIYPWNFDEKIDHEKSEEAFIRRMTGACTYLAGEQVLPKHSLLYSKFCALNELNNLSVDGKQIGVEVKQIIYHDLFECSKRRLTKKGIEKYLIASGFMQPGQVLSGVDDTVKSVLKSYHDFKHLLHGGILTEADAEEIIARITITTDKRRLRNWLKNNYSQLSEKDRQYLSNLGYQDYGRLSRTFLEEILEVNSKTGEVFSERNVITALWETNDNLMQLLSDRYHYLDAVETFNRDYYIEHPQTLDQKMDAMYLSKAVRRSVTRTLDIAKELKGLLPAAPDRIFVEMARADELEKKGQRSNSRRKQIEDWFKSIRKNIPAEELAVLEQQLGRVDDNRLRST